MLPSNPDLFAEIWTLIQQIPAGKVSTYGGVARALGDVGASRFVGEVMMDHAHTDNCLCHRLVRSDGALGKHISRDVAQKRASLQREGVVVQGDAVELSEFGWCEFRCNAPLSALSNYQSSIAELANVTGALAMPKSVGGVDVSFVPGKNSAVAAYVEVEPGCREVCYEKTFRAEINFPYIPGYLAFRELSLLLELLKLVREERNLAKVLMVDGSGILHPRSAGIATMLGVATGATTIGLTKKRLCGKVDLEGLDENTFREVELDGVLSGFAMLPGSGTKKPIYVSPGHGIDAASSLAILQQCRTGRRLPEPIYWADRISRAVAKAE